MGCSDSKLQGGVAARKRAATRREDARADACRERSSSNGRAVPGSTSLSSWVGDEALGSQRLCQALAMSLRNSFSGSEPPAETRTQSLATEITDHALTTGIEMFKAQQWLNAVLASAYVRARPTFGDFNLEQGCDTLPSITLVSVESLLSCAGLADTKPIRTSFKRDGKVTKVTSFGLTSHLIGEKYWPKSAPFNQITSLLPAHAFYEMQWSTDGAFESGGKPIGYGVLTYQWSAPWPSIIHALKKIAFGVKYLWIDVFCLQQNLKDKYGDAGDWRKMTTINQSSDIYARASEYHVLGVSVLDRGWCNMEVGSATVLLTPRRCLLAGVCTTRPPALTPHVGDAAHPPPRRLSKGEPHAWDG